MPHCGPNFVCAYACAGKEEGDKDTDRDRKREPARTRAEAKHLPALLPKQQWKECEMFFGDQDFPGFLKPNHPLSTETSTLEPL